MARNKPQAEDYAPAKVTAAHRRSLVRAKLEKQDRVQIRVRAGRSILTLATIGGIPFKVQRNPTKDVIVSVPMSVAQVAFERYDREIPSPISVFAEMERPTLEGVGEPIGAMGYSTDKADAAATGLNSQSPDIEELVSKGE